MTRSCLPKKVNSMRIRAAVLHRTAEDIRVERLMLKPPQAGEVLVRMEAAGVCGSDWQVCTGATPHVLPAALGHEGAGTVEKVGPGCTMFAPGDRVILNWAPACEVCWYCGQGRPNLCSGTKDYVWKGLMPDGTPRMYGPNGPVYQYCGLGCFADYVVVPESACVQLHPEVPMMIGALLGCCVTTGVGAAVRTARVKAGSSVAVVGAGGVGLSIILGAGFAGADPIIAVDTVTDRAGLARRLGARHFVAASDQMPNAIRSLTEGRGADYVFDATGLPAVQEQCLEAARPGGKVILVGLAPVGSRTNLPGSVITREEKTVTGSYYGSANPREDFDYYARCYLAGKLNLDALITRTYSLEAIRDAYRDLLAGELARGIIVFDLG